MVKKNFLSLWSYPLLGVGKYYINEDIKEESKDLIWDEKEENSRKQFLEDIISNKLSFKNYHRYKGGFPSIIL